MSDLPPHPLLDALSEIARAINASHAPDVLLGRVLDIAMAALEAERGFILLTTEGADATFEINHQRNFAGDAIGDTAHPSTTVVQEVLRTGEPVLVYEALHDERFGTNKSIVLQQIQSIACVPLQLSDRLIGALYLDSLNHRVPFTRESLPFLRVFAQQAAVAIESVRRYERIREENQRLQAEVQRVHGFEGIIGQSPRMRDVFEVLARVVKSDLTVLIEGESGTGKELIARALHYNGDRAKEPFVAIFCGSLPDELLESELFGHKRGAFTGATADKKGLFEIADKGTVFLDEVGDLSPRLQRALLRVLQEGEIKRVGETRTRSVDVRVVSATNKPMKGLVQEGSFREDLYYRLNTITVQMPPLRHRKGDTVLLAHHFLRQYATGKWSHVQGFAPEAVAALKRHTWPGNVRELENTVERAVVLARGADITVDDLHLPPLDAQDPLEVGITLKEAERRLALRTLEELGGNVSEAARVLGISRRTLYNKMNEWESPDA